MFDLNTIAKINAVAEKRARVARLQLFCKVLGFTDPGAACAWARANAHDAFTAFCTDGRTILVQPYETGHWVWTDHVCPVSPRAEDIDGLVIPDVRGAWPTRDEIRAQHERYKGPTSLDW